ncbi:L-lactate permease [Brachybacterium sp. GPGPB12]|uniref:L-lactate permease n=1 Tax=Brachybacterium sp. GPGPB12 TaxID=3023517 RepID=UPI0031344089
MWTQTLDPLDNLLLSALAAALPIFVFLLLMVVLKLSGVLSGLIALAVEVLVALIAYGMPATAVAGAGLSGSLTALWPIAYIIVMAVWLYRLAVLSGRFDIIRDSIGAVSADQRIQVSLISFAFGAFLEGVAGFGVPIAICAAPLVRLGFAPMRAAVLSLIANVGAGAYGAIGIPVLVGAQVTGMEVMDLSRMMVVILRPLTLVVPFLLVMVMDGVRGLRETFPMTLVVSLAFSGVQAGVLWFIGPELADIGAGLAGMVAVFAVARAWAPERIHREDDAPVPVPRAHSFNEVVVAWSPFYILSAFILLWSLPPVEELFTTGALGGTTIAVPRRG